jgi:hypothetical protein
MDKSFPVENVIFKEKKYNFTWRCPCSTSREGYMK